MRPLNSQPLDTIATNPYKSLHSYFFLQTPLSYGLELGGLVYRLTQEHIMPHIKTKQTKESVNFSFKLNHCQTKLSRHGPAKRSLISCDHGPSTL